MSDRPDPRLQSFAEHTRARPDEIAALRRQLPSPVEVARSTRPPRRTWMLAGATLAAGLLGWVVLRPTAAPPPEPLSAVLTAQGGTGELTLGAHVRLEYTGSGRVEGDAARPRVHWERGRIALTVEPRSGVDLEVRTPDAAVAVTGTRFSVERDLLGTHVSVERGSVSVRCVGGSDHALGPEQAHTCLPATPGGLLARARALDEAGAPSEEVLETLAVGMATTGLDSPIGVELHFLALSLERQADNPEAALAHALAILRAGASLRRDAVASAAVELALSTGDCDGAAEGLAALPAPQQDAWATTVDACHTQALSEP